MHPLDPVIHPEIFLAVFYLRDPVMTALHAHPLKLDRPLPRQRGTFGAADRDRTCDFLITSEALYQLSYSGLLVAISCHQHRRQSKMIEILPRLK